MSRSPRRCFLASTALAAAFAAPLLAAQAAAAASAAAAPTHFPADAPGAAPYTLPDPLTSNAGQKITTAQQWRDTRRPEILELFRQHVYGRVPATNYERTFKLVREDRKAMDGAATLRQVEIVITAGGKSLPINLTLFVPNSATAAKPAPAFLLICNRGIENIDPTREKKSPFWPAEAAIARGYAIAAFFNGDVDPDLKADTDFKDGIHAVLDRGPRAPDAWATLAAWAWGASRCLDYLETVPQIARDRVAVIGHSRGGKAALWAGAEDERFALICSNDSGCGGAALSRRQAKGKETVEVINRSFPHWFNRNFHAYSRREAALPVDQHMLMALLAPRPVAVGSARLDLWADPRGEFLSVVHAGPVYRLFGKQALGAAPEMPPIGQPLHGDAAHYHIRDGKHDLTVEDWNAYMDFADRTWGKPTR